MAEVGDGLAELVVQSLYGMRGQRPRVQLSCGAKDFTIQLSVAEARNVAIDLIEACAAAEFDAVIVEWCRDYSGTSDEQMIGLALADFRKRLKATAEREGWMERG